MLFDYVCTGSGCKQSCKRCDITKLQEHIIPIYHLTKKGIPFYWGEEQDKAFKEIKKCLVQPPVLVMPNETGHFVLVSDTSKDSMWVSFISRTTR